jgi:hypothetical protein
MDVLFGPMISKLVVAASSLTVASLAAALGVISGGGTQAKAVAADPMLIAQMLQAMPGAQKLLVNSQASPALAAAAMSTDSNKIEAAPGQENKLEALANKA